MREMIKHHLQQSYYKMPSFLSEQIIQVAGTVTGDELKRVFSFSEFMKWWIIFESFMVTVQLT